MSYATTNAGFAVLSLVANAVVILILVGFVTARFSAHWQTRWDGIRVAMRPFFLAAAWVVAAFCTSASLYLQFGEHLEPCDLCWFQRIFMYPQAILLGIAVATADVRGAKKYFIAMSLLGAVISVLHIELTPIMNALNIRQFPGCSLYAPCTVQPVTEFGFITIPYMALSGFLAIGALLLMVRSRAANPVPPSGQ